MHHIFTDEVRTHQEPKLSNRMQRSSHEPIHPPQDDNDYDENPAMIVKMRYRRQIWTLARIRPRQPAISSLTTQPPEQTKAADDISSTSHSMVQPPEKTNAADDISSISHSMVPPPEQTNADDDISSISHNMVPPPEKTNAADDISSTSHSMVPPSDESGLPDSLLSTVSNTGQPMDKLTSNSTMTMITTEEKVDFSPVSGHNISQAITHHAISYPCLYNITLSTTSIRHNSMSNVHSCVTCRMAVNMSINGLLLPVCASNICRSKLSCLKSYKGFSCLCESHCVAMGVCCANYLSNCLSIWNEGNTSMASLDNNIMGMSLQGTVLGSQDSYQREAKRCAASFLTKTISIDDLASISPIAIIATNFHILHRYIKCTPVTVENGNHVSYLMVSGCPEDVPDELIEYKYKCLNPSVPTKTNSQYIITQSIVIMDNHIFRNIYCAYCHGFNISNPKYLTPSVICDQTNVSDLVKVFHKGWPDTLETFISQCDWFHAYHGKDSVLMDLDHYLCPQVTNYITHCNHSLNNTIDKFESLNNACMLYISNMVSLSSLQSSAEHVGSLTLYKNAHCALCNGITDLHELACVPRSMLHTPSRIDTRPAKAYQFRSFFILLDLDLVQSVPELKRGNDKICLGGMLLDISTDRCVVSHCAADVSNCSNLPQSRRPNIIYMDIESPRDTNQFTLLLCVFADGDDTWNEQEIKYSVTRWFGVTAWYDGVYTNVSVQLKISSLNNSSTCYRYFFSDEYIVEEMITREDKWPYFGDGMYKAFKALHMHLEQIHLFNYNYSLELGTQDGLCELDTKLVQLTNVSMLKSHSSVDITEYQLYYSTDNYPKVLDENALVQTSLFYSGYAKNQYMWDKTISIQTCIPAVLMCDRVLLPNGTFELNNYTLSYLYVDFPLKGDGSYYIDNGSMITCRDFIPMKTSRVTKAPDEVIQKILSIVCLTTSLIGLCCTIAVHLLTPNLRKSVSSQLLINYSMALLVAQLLFLLCGVVQYWPLTCTIFAIGQHFFCLASVIWTSVICADVYCVFSRFQTVDSIGRVRLSLYYVVGWVLPAAFVVVCALLDIFTDLRFGYGDHGTCWITRRSALIATFLVPLCAALVLNTILICAALATIVKSMKIAEAINVCYSGREKLGIYLRLISMTGLTWVFGLLANVTEIDFLVYPFILFNGSQGVIVCASFCTGQKVREEIHDAWRRH